jgi:hypothetical protein
MGMIEELAGFVLRRHEGSPCIDIRRAILASPLTVCKWRNARVLADEPNGNFPPISVIGGGLLIEF